MLYNPTEYAAFPQGRPAYGGTNLLVLPGGRYQGKTVWSPTVDTIYYFPFEVRTPNLVANLFVEFTAAAAAGKLARLGIYAADKDWQPGALMLPSVAVAADAIAVVSAAYSVTLPPGRYLIATNQNGASQYRVYYMRGEGTDGLLRTMGTTPLADLWYVSAAYAALPDPGTPWDTIRSVDSQRFFPVFLDITTP